MASTHELLRSLGFSEGEVTTYLTVLEIGAANVVEITRASKLSRQTVYNSLETLQKKGLISTVQKGKKNNYIAEDPERVLSYIHRKEHDLQEQAKDFECVLPQLKLKKSGMPTTVRVFEGKEGALAILEDMAQSGTHEVLEIADLEPLFAVFDERDITLIRKALAKNKKLMITGFYVGEPKGKTARSQRYYLPKEQGGFNTDVMIYDNKIAMIDTEGKLQSAIIENSALARTFRLLFKLALRSAKDFLTDKPE